MAKRRARRLTIAGLLLSLAVTTIGIILAGQPARGENSLQGRAMTAGAAIAVEHLQVQSDNLQKRVQDLSDTVARQQIWENAVAVEIGKMEAVNEERARNTESSQRYIALLITGVGLVLSVIGALQIRTHKSMDSQIILDTLREHEQSQEEFRARHTGRSPRSGEYVEDEH